MFKIAVVSGTLLLMVALLGALAVLVAGCSLHRPVSAARVSSLTVAHGPEPALTGTAQTPDAAADIEVVRVGGDMHTATEFINGEFRSGVCRISTPLPEGYPAPTPPNTIELKRYPAVRRAGIGGSMSPDWGMNLAFFPLFNHIKRREIAMTSPVELDYAGLGAPGATKPTEWTMSFLYRTPELGPAGIDSEDTRVLVEDVPPVTVVALGMRGPYQLEHVNSGLAALRDWLASQSDWEEAGDPRALFYNGPEVRPRDKWSEVQIPLRRR